MAASSRPASVVLVLATLAGTMLSQQPTRQLAPVEPREADFAAWRKHLEPAGRELRWESVPWLSTFGEGLLAADREGKPLLLWTMNGHPLGCT